MRLTGREQRRFLADGRTPEQQKAGRPRNRRPVVHCRVQRRRPHHGLVLKRMGLRVGRRSRDASSQNPIPQRSRLLSHPIARRQDGRDLGSSCTPGTSVKTRFACTIPRQVSWCSHSNPSTTEPTCWRSRPTAPSSSPDSTGAPPSSGTCAAGKRQPERGIDGRVRAGRASATVGVRSLRALLRVYCRGCWVGAAHLGFEPFPETLQVGLFHLDRGWVIGQEFEEHPAGRPPPSARRRLDP